jgi:hypothetical protein
MMGLQIYFAQLDAGGAKVGADVPLSDPSLGTGGTAQVAWTGSEYAVIWGENPGTGGEVQLARVSAGGAPIGTQRAVTESGGMATFGSITAREGGIALAWSDTSGGDPDIRVAELDATGALIGPEITVSDDTTPSVGPFLQAAHAGYAMAWTDQLSQTTSRVLFAVVCP